MLFRVGYFCYDRLPRPLLYKNIYFLNEQSTYHWLNINGLCYIIYYIGLPSYWRFPTSLLMHTFNTKKNQKKKTIGYAKIRTDGQTFGRTGTKPYTNSSRMSKANHAIVFFFCFFLAFVSLMFPKIFFYFKKKEQSVEKSLNWFIRNLI